MAKTFLNPILVIWADEQYCTTDRKKPEQTSIQRLQKKRSKELKAAGDHLFNNTFVIKQHHTTLCKLA